MEINFYKRMKITDKVANELEELKLLKYSEPEQVPGSNIKFIKFRVDYDGLQKKLVDEIGKSFSYHSFSYHPGLSHCSPYEIWIQDYGCKLNIKRPSVGLKHEQKSDKLFKEIPTSINIKGEVKFEKGENANLTSIFY